MNGKLVVGCWLLVVGLVLPMVGKAYPSGSGVSILGGVTNGNLAEISNRGVLRDSGISANGIDSQIDSLVAFTNGIVAQAYGSVYIHDGTNVLTLVATNAYYRIQPFTTNTGDNCTLTSSNIVIASDGVYNIIGSVSFAGANDDLYEMAIFTNDAHSNIGEENFTSTAAGVYTAMRAVAQHYLVAGTKVSLHLQDETAAGTTATIKQAYLGVTKIGLTYKEMPIVQTLSGDSAAQVPSVAAVNDGLDEKANIVTNVYSVSNLTTAVRTIDSATEDDLNWTICLPTAVAAASSAVTITAISTNDLPDPSSTSAILYTYRFPSTNTNVRTYYTIPLGATKVRTTVMFPSNSIATVADGAKMSFFIAAAVGNTNRYRSADTVSWCATNAFYTYTNTFAASALNSPLVLLDIYKSPSMDAPMTNAWQLYVMSVEAYIPRQSGKVLGTLIKDMQADW
jgi:hypothetical protein